MANESSNKTISSTNSGFPDYLNFDKLRSEAIAYLGNLSGKIWTDHNVHDPGITILEMLIYALLDLGYRTNLPVADLFARNPNDTSGDNNFFTPAQILTNNPLTITDYRKLLVDINGVKNAWLEIDTDTPSDFCSNTQGTIPGNYNIAAVDRAVNIETICECDMLNGLYHVFLQLEKDFDLNDEKQKSAYDEIIDNVKCALMQHRNLCEDFIDIKVLCNLDIGLCADIELDADANGEEVYVKIIEALQSFFSPAPKFYTLPQLLEKGKSIEDIFAGRSYNLKESYGFVDTDEFEEIELRREIHFSDVYHVLLDIEGVKNIRRFAWKECNNASWQTSQWKLILPENNIPAFKVECSSFSFFKYGMALKVDQKEYDSFFQVNNSSAGKILYTQPSQNLDAEIPKGIYHDDLANYYSIQNEFPHVYGIGAGDLTSNEPNDRKAKALQLQGFLLFFDQLLANYLTQLKNIRSLFALSSSETDKDNHTYFINELTNVPQFQKLLRFKTDVNSTGTLGSEGSILAYPTERKKFETLISSGKIKNTDLKGRCNKDDFPEYKFCYAAVRDQAVLQLKDDLLYGAYEAVVESNNDECFFFYIITSSVNFVLISRNYYRDEQEARNAAASVKYTASFAENFRSFMSLDCADNIQLFSFDIELTLDTYAGYLQLIAEDESLYLSRRQDFLNHLLARFAEQFTDYALLSANFLSKETLQKSQIKAEEKFLTHYPDLSSNRGKAYNYLCNGWKNENVSGFEKRFKALAGIEDWRKHYLCNFSVEEIDKLYQPQIEIDKENRLTLQTPLNKADAIASVNALYSRLNENAFFEMNFVEHENKWQLYTRDDFNNKYIYSKLLDTKEEAESLQASFQNIFLRTPGLKKNIFVSRFIYKVQFADSGGKLLAEYAGDNKNDLTDKQKAEQICTVLASEINSNLNDAKIFTWENEKADTGNLIPVQTQTAPVTFINEKAFDFYSLEAISLIEDIKFTYTFRDINKKILFRSVTKYDDETQARKAFETVLPLLTLQSSYFIDKTDNNALGLFIKSDDANIATYFEYFDSEEKAKNKINDIIKEVAAYTYTLYVSEPIPNQWKFKFWLTDAANKKLAFASKDMYPEENLALNAAQKFYSDIPRLQVKTLKNEWFINSPSEKIKVTWQNNTEDGNEINTAKSDAASLLKLQQALFNETTNIPEEQVNSRLKNWQVNKTENYKYKLVDKDNPIAEHTAKLKLLSVAEAETERTRLIHETYNFIDINISGNDVFCYYEDDKTKTLWYHYQIKCTNRFYTQGKFTGKELVLFQSIKGYTSKEEALNAFNDNCFIILQYAQHAENYGDNKFISLKEYVTHTNNDCYEAGSMVCVPQQTNIELGGYEVQNEIIPIVKSYPVKYIVKGRYRFSVYNAKLDFYDWRSVTYYGTPQQAMQQFQFFLILLKYSGNYYIDEDKTICAFHIYIREVLAESLHGFNTCEEAWNGIEKFICISQTEKSFHNYFRSENCSHSFFIACRNTGLLHPCSYETPERRDDVINKLYQAASFNFFELLQTNADNITLLNTDGKEVARIYLDEKNNNCSESNCEKLIDFFESVYINERYIFEEKENRFYLLNSCGFKVAEPVFSSITLEEWKQQLLKVACYFPITRKEVTANQRLCNFYIRIKLPAFDSCEDDLTQTDTGCENAVVCNPGCYLAWKSDCCFNSCCEALQFYMRTLLIIRNYDNYKKVYECDCGYYGIELHLDYFINRKVEARSAEINNMPGIINFLCYDEKDAADAYDNSRYERINRCANEIVAVNPQQYTNEIVACDAVERAKKLINSEGLHLVEHILLRPQCKNTDGIYDDCNCNALPKPCIDYRNDYRNICNFRWEPGEDPDPCEDKTNPLCFTPGCDPYSFVATVALPAWPQRFRSKENRAVIEKLLQKEAPAHVLLRTLWLNPRDFCCFEYEFKNWNYWLAKKLCANYNNCDFLEFLFKKKFAAFADCEECLPCSCDVEEPVSCFETEEDNCDDFNSRINDLFCWNRDDSNYNFSICEPCNCREEDTQTNNDGEVILKKAKKKTVLEILTNVEHRAQIEANEKNKTVALPSREKAKQIQARAYAYNENVKKIIESNLGNKVAENALRFLSDVNPGPKRYDDLINQVLNNKSDKSKKVKALSLKNKQALIQNITWQYLDRICFSDNEMQKIKQHESLFNHLRKNKIDMHAVYEEWKANEVKKIEPAVDINEIKRLLT